MPSYKLWYFNGTGRAEVIRLIFKVAEVEFEDWRMERDEWIKVKDETPFGQVPILEVDGDFKLAQSNAIARYLATKFGMAGDTVEEKAKIDMIGDCLNDLITDMAKVYFAKEEGKEEMMKKAIEEKIDPFFQRLEKFLIANNGGDGFLVGDKLSWADLFLAAVVDMMQLFKFEVDLAKYPKVNGLNDRVINIPTVAKWFQDRPKMNF